jgi:hypothetical protein
MRTVTRLAILAAVALALSAAADQARAGGIVFWGGHAPRPRPVVIVAPAPVMVYPRVVVPAPPMAAVQTTYVPTVTYAPVAQPVYTTYYYRPVYVPTYYYYAPAPRPVFMPHPRPWGHRGGFGMAVHW